MRIVKFFFFFIILFASAFAQERMEYGLVIHGGAGSITAGSIPKTMEALYESAMKQALDAGYKILSSGGSSLDAVEAAVVILEDSPLFNAAKGAVLNNEGKAELDASIMDGRTGQAGAAAGLHHIKNPIRLARLVMEKSPHVMMAGDGAEKFAGLHKLEFVDEEYFITPTRLQQLKLQQEKEKKDTTGSITPGKDSKFGTVGAVALDQHGNLAAATSTGGMMNKRYGRVGDSPIIGAGTFAGNNSCAVSCTGHGEFFIRNSVAFDVSARMLYKGMSLKQAAHEIVNDVLVKLKGDGGLIAIDKDGNFTMPFNTSGMFRGYINQDGKSEVLFYK